jgi:hypothetical protein
MTLFLGIQNFIAERRHVESFRGRNKRQRKVLLDNPFRKASSDHVLAPVFKIADQLGFQLIAFTAHIEGKFISAQKEINYAFLQDQSPVTIVRMNKLEHEQLSIF